MLNEEIDCHVAELLAMTLGDCTERKTDCHITGLLAMTVRGCTEKKDYHVTRSSQCQQHS